MAQGYVSALGQGQDRTDPVSGWPSYGRDERKRICSPVILEDPEAVLDCFARLMAAKAAETKQQTPGLELSISPRCTRGLGRLAALIQATSREALVLLPALDSRQGKHPVSSGAVRRTLRSTQILQVAVASVVSAAAIVCIAFAWKPFLIIVAYKPSTVQVPRTSSQSET